MSTLIVLFLLFLMTRMCSARPGDLNVRCDTDGNLFYCTFLVTVRSLYSIYCKRQRTTLLIFVNAFFKPL